jgi:hypothetical protein
VFECVCGELPHMDCLSLVVSFQKPGTKDMPLRFNVPLQDIAEGSAASAVTDVLNLDFHSVGTFN